MKTYKRNKIINKNLSPSDFEKPIIRIAQWNIFAQGFVVADNFQHCSPCDLSLTNRKILYKNEFDFINADIYCFQEADINEELLNILNECSPKYSKIFAKKEHSACLFYPDNYGPDGCLIIYNQEKYLCLENRTFPFEKNGKYICLFAVFSVISNNNIKFIIACTHLKSKKEYKEKRIRQCEKLLAELDKLRSQYNAPFAFICGDFNASPNEEAITNVKKSPLNFINVYDELKDNSSKSQYFTTWSFRKDWKETKRIPPFHQIDNMNKHEYEDVIDYIWYTNFSDPFSPSSNNHFSIKPISIFDVPDKTEIGNYGIPSNRYPSDHISLISDFIINDLNT